MAYRLILLIGNNPLPNYVVAKYFLETKRELYLYLISSEETKKYSEEIVKCLKSDISNKENYNLYEKYICLEDCDDSKSIKNDIQKQLKDCFNDNDEINLNYTGGTKAMAVHVYATIKELFSNSNLDFSYISARDNSLKYDLDESKNIPISDKINVILETLIKLHGYEKGSEDRGNIYQAPLKEIKELIKNNYSKEYLHWVKDFIDKNYRNEKGFKLTKKDFDSFNDNYQKIENDHNDNLKNYHWLGNLLKEIPNDVSLIENGELLNPYELKNNSYVEKRLKNTLKFLNGIWLEDYVYEIINSQNKKADIQKGSKIKKPLRLDDFELDVIIVNSYITTLISCTTDKTTHLCKLKGFEALHRVSEIGGDEGKVILITALDNEQRDKLQDDLNKIANLKEDKLLVLGIEDWEEKIIVDKINRFVFI